MEIFNNIILIILSIATVVFVIDAVGFLPYKYSKMIMKNRLSLTRDVLKDLGLPVREFKKTISNCFSTEKIEELEKKLSKITYKIKVEIGNTTKGYYFNSYIDLMGATANKINAQDFAGRLKKYVEQIDEIDLEKIDLIVTSKLGSPILGYEFAKNIEKKFILHSSEEKFNPMMSNKYKINTKFDTGGCYNLEGKNALIVDDSTTGGRKIEKIINDLRENSINVSHCLTIFAPQGKNAEKKLLKSGVTLISIIKTHNQVEE
jgi:orotate phosphoribosyltransferase